MLSQFIVDYDLNNRKFIFKRYKVTFEKDGVLNTLFANDLEYANSYSKNIPGINGYQITELGTVVEYDERLTALNKLNLDDFTCTTYLQDINKFILTGLLNKEHEVVPLRDLAEAYKDKAKEYYYMEVVNILKKIRQEKQLGGIVYGKHLISSGPDDLNIVKGTYEQIKNGFITYVDFKVSDTEFIRLDHDKSLDILLSIQSHTQACFTVEGKLQEYLKTLSMDELRSLIPGEKHDQPSKINLKAKFNDYYTDAFNGISNKLEVVKLAAKEEYRKVNTQGDK